MIPSSYIIRIIYQLQIIIFTFEAKFEKRTCSWQQLEGFDVIYGSQMHYLVVTVSVSADLYLLMIENAALYGQIKVIDNHINDTICMQGGLRFLRGFGTHSWWYTIYIGFKVIRVEETYIMFMRDCLIHRVLCLVTSCMQYMQFTLFSLCDCL